MSDNARDTVAESIAGGIGWVGDLLFGNLAVTGWVVLGLVGLFLLWRLSVLLAPSRLCWHCKGKGYRPGTLGGVKKCEHCDGGLQSRVGSSDR